MSAAGKPESSASGTVALSLGLVVRGALQAALFVVLARILGPAELGLFTAVLSVMSILCHFTGLGTGILLVRDISVDPAAYGRVLGRSVLLTAVTALPVAALGGVIAFVLLPPGTGSVLIVCVALAEAAVTPFVDLAGRACQSTKSFRLMAGATIAPIAARLVFLCGLGVTAGEANAAQWSVAYLFASVVACAVIWWLTLARLGRPTPAWAGAPAAIREGLHVAISNVAIRANADADKAILARFASAHDVGLYAVAQRFVELAIIPILAALESSLPGLFRSGHAGIGSALRAAVLAGRVPLAYACVASIVLFAGAPVLEWILGEPYRPAVDVLRWLSILPPILCARYFLRGILLSASRVRLSGAIESGGAVAAIASNAAGIPLFGWQTAIVVKIAVEAGMLGCALLAVARGIRRDAGTAS